ncbi:MAG: TRAP transporter substrate-binding protein [Marinosulfonomonas sp.]|nr:TRAP transporter substrate-binding protein [Marinosulfonomonas sp.]
MKLLKKIIGAVVLPAMLLGAAGPAISADVIELKLSHYVPAGHGMHRDFMEPWARELEKRTNGQVKVTIHPGGTQLGVITKQYDQVRSGIVDIAMGLHGIPRGRFPRTSITDLPFLAETADGASKVLWALYPKYLAEEHPGVKMLALFGHNAGLIHTKGRQVKTMDDLKGLRIRTPSAAASEMLTFLGATPQGLPPTQVYESIQKGVLDGTLFPWDPVNSFKLFEVLDYHLDAGVYSVSFYFAMNQKKYDSLPEDVRAVIDEMSGDALVAKFGPWWDAWDVPGHEKAVERGNTIVKLSPEERQRWREALAPMADEWLTKLEKESGIANAREIYSEAQRLSAEFEK